MGLRDRVRRLIQRPGTIDLTPLRATVAEAGAREDRVRALSDAELTAAAAALRGTGGEDLAELCALGREAARRTLGERPFDVQLIGTLGMLSGHVVEMATGEGKTLAGALAAAGYALRGRRVHVMSVNDYLARRDAEWMEPLYALLGVPIAWVGQNSTPDERRAAYAAEVTYAPVSEIGFDLLRDRLCTDTADRVLPAHEVALIDEADSVLIDEARVPLVLAGAAELQESEPAYAEVVRLLLSGVHYKIDDERRNVQLTSAGTEMVERALGGIDLYTTEHVEALTGVNVALHAHALLRRDVDYIVRDGKVRLINESRGRVALLQRWPDGLQAAVEAKEALDPTESGEILDSVTVQGLIGGYPTVCGMTGTAVAVAEQLREFYRLEVAVVPPNVPCVREDAPDRLYATVADKEIALVEHISAVHVEGRPILVGTLDIAESERLARRLERAKLSCVVLNAKNDAAEAAIVAEAGTYGRITVSTQIAGRGTDIRLGGAATADGDDDHDGDGDGDGDKDGEEGDSPSARDRVAQLGGLYVIGTGRHHSSRLDDQLRGRAGRQGDPGGSVFFASLEDDLTTQYAPDEKPDATPDVEGRIEDANATWVVGHAQRVAEGVDLEIHRNTWRYSRLIELQRREVLAERDGVLRTEAAADFLAKRSPDRHAELLEAVGRPALVAAARQIALYHLDRCWTEHLGFLADLREGIHLRSLARGLNPLDEFHRDAVPVYKRLLGDARDRAVKTFEALTPTADGELDLSDAGLQRPSATWTYLVHDNPFGAMDERAIKGLVAMFRRRAR
ncbi:accessory Sec system translocase SecA2 [Actinomadura alba]|uniref:Protein translocase subunit SecA n=1 Tax=Actinomadura alba TaxID=406431 RepID=A0ABR7LVR8_9ACTN|nr:accessory Sec system translocase SecA2 [Actinomadura alba]MBC6468946.1 accessory Sec system translocase SecA2 [Actinomadura alba]